MPRTKPKTTLQPNAVRTTVAPNAQNAEPNEVLTLAEAAAYLRLSEAEVILLTHQRGLPGQLVGKDGRFLKSAIQEWLRTPQVLPSREAFWETHFGALKDDPYLEEMLEQVYKQRGRPEIEAR